MKLYISVGIFIVITQLEWIKQFIHYSSISGMESSVWISLRLFVCYIRTWRISLVLQQSIVKEIVSVKQNHTRALVIVTIIFYNIKIKDS